MFCRIGPPILQGEADFAGSVSFTCYSKGLFLLVYCFYQTHKISQKIAKAEIRSPCLVTGTCERAFVWPNTSKHFQYRTHAPFGPWLWQVKLTFFWICLPQPATYWVGWKALHFDQRHIQLMLANFKLLAKLNERIAKRFPRSVRLPFSWDWKAVSTLSIYYSRAK